MKAAAAAAKSLQSCPNLCDPIDGSPPWSDLRSPGKISRLDEPPRYRWEFSQKVRERTTWGDQVSVNKARTLFSKVVFIP